MFDTKQKSTGTQYTMTVAWLIGAFILSPVVLTASRPVGYISLSLALACSALCVGMAWVSWSRHSKLTIPSIASHDGEAK